MKTARVSAVVKDGSTSVYTLSDGAVIRLESSAVDECGLGVMMRVYGYDIATTEPQQRKPPDTSRIPIFQNGDQVGTLPKDHPGDNRLFRTFEGWIASPTCNVQSIVGFED